MDHERLNRLAIAFRDNGDEDAFAELYVTLHPYIHQAINKVEGYVLDTSSFEKRIDKQIRDVIRLFNEKAGKIASFVALSIKRETAFFIERTKKEYAISLDYLNEMASENGGFVITDSKPSVEDSILLREGIALLAQGDSRKLTILREWSRGANDTEISKVLAHHYGGSLGYQRQYIIRFRKKLRDTMPRMLA